MTVTLTPAPLVGTIPAIASKSAAHRLLICAALADRPTELSLNALSEDIAATISCLRAMGARISRRGEAITVTPIAGAALRPALNCGESGSTLRFLLPVAAAVCRGASFSGRGRLPERPLAPLMDAMRAKGVSFSAESLPFEIDGRLRGGVFELPGDVSSQFVSGLLLALPLLEEDSEIALTSPLLSAGYADMTRAVLGGFGVAADETSEGYFVRGGQRPVSPVYTRVEGDWSNAAFMLCAGAVGGNVTVTGLDLNSPQGDRKIVEMLRAFGAAVEVNGGAVSVSGGKLKAVEIDVSQTPDLLPALSVLAALAEGESRFTGAARLRMKECDRLNACAQMINSLGGRAEEALDSLTVYGGGLDGGSAEGFGDHRMVMAAAVASAGCRNAVTISGAEAVGKSYPGFFEDLAYLRAHGAP